MLYKYLQASILISQNVSIYEIKLTRLFGLSWSSSGRTLWQAFHHLWLAIRDLELTPASLPIAGHL